jgi:hypothetical protein
MGGLAVRVVVAAALLGSVHPAAAAAQETNPPSPRQGTTSEIDGLVRQVLADRIIAKDIPDWGLLRGATRIAVRSDPVRLPIGKDALPALDGYDLRLITAEEAQTEAERTHASNWVWSYFWTRWIAEDWRTIGACSGITSTAPLLAHARFLPTVGRS